MKPRTGLLLLALTAGLLSAAGPADAFAPIKAQIDTLLEHRRQLPPFAPAVDNPFKRPGGEGELVAVTTAPTTPGAARPAATLDLIHRLAAQLRVSGTVNVNGRMQVIINSTACEEGRMLPVREGEMLYRLLVKTITPTAVVIQLGEAEMTISIR
jgi:hypothetical protein